MTSVIKYTHVITWFDKFRKCIPQCEHQDSQVIEHFCPPKSA